jgi:four helix bundle protein
VESGLKNFTAYKKALELFDLVVHDLGHLASRFELSKLVSQQIASADSIAANIEEGYGRGSEPVRKFVFGSKTERTGK